MYFFENELIVSEIVLAIRVPKGKGTPIHRDRPSHGLAYHVDCGAVYHFETGERLTCHSGECIYLPKGSNYTVSRDTETSSEDGGVYAINFHICPEQMKSRPFVMRVRARDEVQSYFSRAVNAWRKKDAGYCEECFMDLYGILKCLKKEREVYAPRTKLLRALAPALLYIESHYTRENIRVARLAEECGVSEPYLRRLFLLAFSVSPAVYIRNQRIEYAKELLSSGEYSVTDAATTSGFNDVAYFSREFKKATGISPKEYSER